MFEFGVFYTSVRMVFNWTVPPFLSDEGLYHSEDALHLWGLFGGKLVSLTVILKKGCSSLVHRKYFCIPYQVSVHIPTPPRLKEVIGLAIIQIVFRGCLFL